MSFTRTITLYIIFIFSLLGGVVAQPVIGTELQQVLENRQDDDLIPVNIHLVQQYDSDLLYDKSLNHFSTHERRNLVIKELQNFSNENQSPLLGFLSQKSAAGKVADIHSFWIINLIHCYVHPSLIEELAIRSDIAFIDYDREYQVLDLENHSAYSLEQNITTNQSQGSATDKNTIAWNVQHVLAHQVWAQGYTGEDIVVAILDTGVNWEHADLQGNMWEHPNYPNHGFNFVGNNFNPMDIQGHGTHCAGTVAGNGASGTITGVAPEAKIMALKVLTDQGSGTQSGVWQGIEFAVEYNAQILSLSLGFRLGNDQNRAIWRQVMDNVRNAGSIAIVASGNEGASHQVPFQVRTPGDVPPPWLHPDQTLVGGTSGVISVGSINNSNTVAPTSSRGPVSWQEISPFNDYPFNPGMGLIRPDIVAPGVNITSLDAANINGYTVKSGTSMAAPAVAGVAALMLSKNPFLLPEEISQLIEETANALSFIKSNSSGSGVVDALAAVNEVSLGVRYAGHQVNDQEGNNDGNINPGEFISMDITMENPTTEIVDDLTVVLRHNSPFVTLQDSIAQFGTFQPGESIEVTDAFSFEVADDMPGNHMINFSLFSTAASNDETWRSGFTEMGHAPDLWIGPMVIEDFSENVDNTIDPGEQALLKFEVRNTGQLPTQNILMQLESLKPYVKILQEFYPSGPLGPDQSIMAQFLVMAHPDIPRGTFSDFSLGTTFGPYHTERYYTTKLGQVIEDWESGDFSQFPWQLSGGGIPQWELDSIHAYSGKWSATIGNLLSNQSSSLSITIDVQEQDSISFYKKMGISPANFANLDFYIDNTRMDRWTGASDWQRITYSIEAGSRTLTWVYGQALPPIEDSQVWIDNIALPIFPDLVCFAGFDNISCGDGAFQTQGYALGHDSLSWSTSGDGIFDDASAMDAIYIPGENDLVAGQLTLTLSVFDEDEQLAASHHMQLSLYEQPPQIDLGDDLLLCMDDIVTLDAGDGFAEYLWVDGTTGQTLTVTAEAFAPQTEIWVIGIDANGCTSRDTVFVQFEICSSIPEEQATNETILIYPNPASGFFTILSDDMIRRVMVYDLTGRLITNLEVNDLTTEVNISHFPEGVYLVRSTTDNGIITRKLFVTR